MTRTLTILAAAAALAVSAAPAWAGSSKKPAQPSTESYTLSNTMISGFSAKPTSDKLRRSPATECQQHRPLGRRDGRHVEHDAVRRTTRELQHRHRDLGGRAQRHPEAADTNREPHPGQWRLERDHRRPDRSLGQPPARLWSGGARVVCLHRPAAVPPVAMSRATAGGAANRPHCLSINSSLRRIAEGLERGWGSDSPGRVTVVRGDGVSAQVRTSEPRLRDSRRH